MGDEQYALKHILSALTLAEPQGYVRVFADEGPPLAALLRQAAVQGTTVNTSASC